MAVSIKLAYRCSTNLFSYNPYITKNDKLGALLLFCSFVTCSTPGKKVEHENIECQFHFGATENEYY